MKKELLAGCLLLALCLGAWLNLRHIDGMTAACIACLERSESAAGRGDPDEALSAFRSAQAVWEREKLYTGVFLSRRDLDGIQDAFFLLEEQLLSGAPGAAPADYARLRQYLEDLAVQERLTAENLL